MNVSNQNNKKYTTLISNSFIFALGSFGAKIISFFLVPLYTNILTREQYGTADLIISYSNIIVPIASLVIQDSVLRFGLSRKYLKGSVLKSAIIVLLFGILICFFFSYAFNIYPSLNEWRLYLFVIPVCNMLHSVVFNYTKAKERNKLYAFASMLNALVLAVVNIVLLVFFKMGVEGYLIANILANIMPTIFLIIFIGALSDFIKSPFDKNLFIDMIKYSVPMIINNLSWWVLNSSDKVMIEKYISSSELGLYTAASKIPAFVYFFISIFSQAWSVSSIKEYETEKNQRFYSNVFSHYSILMFFTCAFIILIIKPFMSFYVGKHFEGCWYLIPPLLVGTTFYSFVAFFSGILEATKKNKIAAITTLIAAISNIIINLLLIPKVGTIAASFSTAVSYIIIAFLRMKLSQKYFHFYIDFRRLYSNSMCIIVLMIAIELNLNIYICSILCIIILLFINLSQLESLLKWVVDQVKNRLKCLVVK